jgi:hypothetical protein
VRRRPRARLGHAGFRAADGGHDQQAAVVADALEGQRLFGAAAPQGERAHRRGEQRRPLAAQVSSRRIRACLISPWRQSARVDVSASAAARAA